MSSVEYLYNPKDATSIESYAKQLIGKTFIDVIEQSATDTDTLNRLITYYGNIARKGGLGNLLEELYFGYKANGNQEADFKEAGVELKASPYEVTKKGELRAGERLVITMISYELPFEPDFYKSHVWEKTKAILLIYYWRNRMLSSNLLYKINYAQIFSPPHNDLIIIRADYEVIKEKVMSGKAHELSESDTLYLGACTKGASAEKSTVSQYYNKNTPARKRAFCFKNSYMTFVLNHYIAGKKSDTETIIKGSLENLSFEDCIANTINKYIGRTDKSLCDEFSREYNNNKAQWVDLSYKMLGIKSNKAEEFEKANIVVKAVRIEENGKMIESMSFPSFQFKELAEESFEDSSLYSYFDETRLFFVVWKKDGDCYRVAGSQLWNMPKTDLDVTVKDGWEAIQRVIRYGVEFTKKSTKNGIVFENNFPKKSDNEIIHIRPHATQSAYRLHDGTEIGNVKRDANELPNGEYMTTQSFWINNSYIVNQLKCLKKES